MALALAGFCCIVPDNCIYQAQGLEMSLDPHVMAEIVLSSLPPKIDGEYTYYVDVDEWTSGQVTALFDDILDGVTRHGARLAGVRVGSTSFLAKLGAKEIGNGAGFRRDVCIVTNTDLNHQTMVFAFWSQVP